MQIALTQYLDRWHLWRIGSERNDTDPDCTVIATIARERGENEIVGSGAASPGRACANFPSYLRTLSRRKSTRIRRALMPSQISLSKRGPAPSKP